MKVAILSDSDIQLENYTTHKFPLIHPDDNHDNIVEYDLFIADLNEITKDNYLWLYKNESDIESKLKHSGVLLCFWDDSSGYNKSPEGKKEYCKPI
ncbi:MAG: hypothetical protein V1701_05195, partial [Planctomycetota bacterium]